MLGPQHEAFTASPRLQPHHLYQTEGHSLTLGEGVTKKLPSCHPGSNFVTWPYPDQISLGDVVTP